MIAASHNLAFVSKRVSFADLAQKLELLLGIPATPTTPTPSMDVRPASAAVGAQASTECDG